MSESPHGMADLRDGIIEDLRSYDPLLAWLPEKQAIYDAWPNEATEYEIQLVIAAVWHGSENIVGAQQRTARVQASVVSTAEWREGRPDAAADMMELMDHAADRFDVACDIPGVWPLGAGGAGGMFNMTDVGQGRRAFTGDWLMQYTTQNDA